MAKRTRRSRGFTVAVLAKGIEVSTKRRRKSPASKLFPGSKRKPPARARVHGRS